MHSDLDPEDWQEVEVIWHKAVEVGLDHLRSLRNQPVWRPTPEHVRDALRAPLPVDSTPIERVFDQFCHDVLPFNTGNAHPSFFGWVHGGGNVYGVIGEMCAAVMNSNVGGRDHVAVYVERQVLQWCREIFHYPEESSGLLTSGTSMATLIALTVARNQACEIDVNEHGLQSTGCQLVGYCSEQTHSSVLKAFQMLGLGAQALRSVPIKDDFTMDLSALARMVNDDQRNGLQPFCVIATAGTVNTGAIDDIAGAAALCKDKSLWLHVDAAFGGFAILLNEYQERLASIAAADSVAFDFHKWLQVPYSVGGLLIRNAEAHQRAFSAKKEYLTTSEQGLAGGAPWFCDYGPELSRSFLALKVWFTIKTLGVQRIADVIRKHCEQASYLAEQVTLHSKLELMAPVAMNIACFRFKPLNMKAADKTNRNIVTQLHLSGNAAPSTTTIRGALAIRVAIVNHRTQMRDLDELIDQVVAIGEKTAC